MKLIKTLTLTLLSAILTCAAQAQIKTTDRGAADQVKPTQSSPATQLPLSDAEVRAKYRNCTDGYYSGPQPGKASYTKDDYLWVVTPEFANAYCLPEHFIDKTLKGAAAIAYKPVYEGAEHCGFGGNGEACSRRVAHGLEVYYASSLKLPSLNDTKYNYRAFNMLPSSKHLLGMNREKLFTPAQDAAWGAQRPGAQARFKLSGWGIDGVLGNRVAWQIAAFREVQYIEELIPDHNYLALEGALGSFTNPRMERLGIKQFVLNLSKPSDGKVHPGDEKLFLDRDFSHVIYLPNRLIEQIKLVDKQGDSAFKALLQKAMPETFGNRLNQGSK